MIQLILVSHQHEQPREGPCLGGADSAVLPLRVDLLVEHEHVTPDPGRPHRIIESRVLGQTSHIALWVTKSQSNLFCLISP